MNLWILRPVEGLPDTDNPWKPWYDKSFGFIVRAETATKARKIAHKNAGDENHGRFLGVKAVSPWLDAHYSTCKALKDEGEAGVIMQDFASA